MKFFGKLFFYITLLALLSACGKSNTSGQSGQYGINGYGVPNGYFGGGIGSVANITSGYSYGGYSLDAVQSQNPCVGSYGTGAQRLMVQVPLAGFPTVISPNDIYVGVTSFGDVGAIIGTGTTPMFVAYICPRSQASGQGSLYGISLGAYSNCAFKPLTAATMSFPDGTTAAFRMLDYGSSAGAKFTFCR
jgi:hypothetical protein